MIRPSKNSAIAKPRYGSLTEDACSRRYACNWSGGIWRTTSSATGAPLKIRRLPNQGASVVPRELKACVKFRRLDAVLSGPKTATYGFADTCKMVIPAASIINAVRNSGNEGALAAGTKSSAHSPIVNRPPTIAFLYPNHSINFPEGNEKIK